MRRTLRLFNLRLSQLSFRLEHWVQLFFLLLVTLLVTLLLRDQSTVMYWLNKSCEAVVCNLPTNFYQLFIVTFSWSQLSGSCLPVECWWGFFIVTSTFSEVSVECWWGEPSPPTGLSSESCFSSGIESRPDDGDPDTIYSLSSSSVKNLAHKSCQFCGQLHDKHMQGREKWHWWNVNRRRIEDWEEDTYSLSTLNDNKCNLSLRKNILSTKAFGQLYDKTQIKTGVKEIYGEVGDWESADKHHTICSLFTLAQSFTISC